MLTNIACLGLFEKRCVAFEKEASAAMNDKAKPNCWGRGRRYAVGLTIIITIIIGCISICKCVYVNEHIYIYEQPGLGT